MMKPFFLLCLLTITMSVSAQQHLRTIQDDRRLRGLDTAFRRVLKTFHTAGFAVAVVEKNKVIYAKGFGYRNVEQKLPVTPNTVFDIGSCTKAFTAAVIGQLQHDGKLDIDQPVSTIMPSLRFYNDVMNNTITIRDMMTHRTGLPRHDFSWAFFPTDSRDSLIQRIRYQEPTASVRERFQYNNFMYVAQGAVIEKVTGKSWEDNVRERIFSQLGMSSTNPNFKYLHQNADNAIGYKVYNSEIRRADEYTNEAMAPCGAMNSNVNDLCKWLVTWINGGKYNGREIIPQDFYGEAISAQQVAGGGLPDKREPGLYFADYGLAWGIRSYKGHYRVGHTGNVGGFSTSIAFFPTDSIGIVVLVNQDDSPVNEVVRNLVSDRLLGQKYDDWTVYYKGLQMEGEKGEQALKKALNAPHKEFPATHSLIDFTGDYFNAGYGKSHIFIQHDSLFTSSAAGTGWLRHYSYDTFDFFGKDKTSGVDTTTIPFRIQFHMSANGGIDGVSGVYEEGLKPIMFTKQQSVIAVAVKDLEKYTGDYDLNSAIVKVYSKTQGSLYVLAPNLPEYELLPIGSDKFAVKAMTGYYAQFEKDSTGKITNVTFIQPTGNYKASKINVNIIH